MRFSRAYLVKDQNEEEVVAVEYFDNNKNRCTSFYKPSVPSAATTLINLINQTVEQEKRDIDDGK